MPTIRDRTIDDLLVSLEDWGKYSGEKESQVFIATVGFEDRASAGFEKWSSARTEADRRAVFILYPTNEIDNARQMTCFTKSAQASGIRIDEVRYKTPSFYGEITSTLRTVNNISSIIVDISTMASYVFYPLMKAIYDSGKDPTVQVLYSEAQKYFPVVEEWQKFQETFGKVDDRLERAKIFDSQHFQSSGVDEIYESPVFPGMNPDKFPGSLVMVPNFSYERVQRMVNFASDRYAVSPSEDIVWMIGNPPDQSVNGWRHDALWEMYNKPDDSVSVSTFEWKQMLKMLHQIWVKKQSQRALIIGTVGSKPQHLATFAFLKMHPEVGLILSEPKEYSAARYSEGCKTIWSVNLGRTFEFNEKLSSWNKLDFYW